MSKPIKNIIIDAGHGGINSKGVYTTQGKYHIFSNGEIAYEGVINRVIAESLADKFKNNNLDVFYTVEPSDYRDFSLSKRVEIINKFSAKNSILISIHNNATLIPGTATGFEIFTTKGQNNSDKLADCIFLEVEKLYNLLNLKVRSDKTDNDYDKESDFYIIKRANMPAVLIECLFFDNKEDFKKLKDQSFINQLTNAICQGVLNYIKQ